MVDINLLPWRQEQHQFHQRMIKRFIAASFAIAMIVVVSSYSWLNGQVENVSSQLIQLEKKQEELTKGKALPQLSDENKHALLLARHALAEKLFVSLVTSAIGEVCLQSVASQKNYFLFIGRTRSAADLMSFLRSWQGVALFSDIEIEQLEEKASSPMLFRFHANIPIDYAI